MGGRENENPQTLGVCGFFCLLRGEVGEFKFFGEVGCCCFAIFVCQFDFDVVGIVVDSCEFGMAVNIL